MVDHYVGLKTDTYTVKIVKRHFVVIACTYVMLVYYILTPECYVAMHSQTTGLICSNLCSVISNLVLWC